MSEIRTIVAPLIEGHVRSLAEENGRLLLELIEARTDLAFAERRVEELTSEVLRLKGEGRRHGEEEPRRVVRLGTIVDADIPYFTRGGAR